MAKFNLEDYEPVEDRIRRFYADHPEGRITADLLTPPEKLGTVIVKASLYVGEILVSTGLAFEKEGEGYVNKTSHLENCETSAIGRALANFNYAGSKRPSREEMGKVANPGEDMVEDRQKIINTIAAEIKKYNFPDKEKDMYREEIKTTATNKLSVILDEIKTAGAALNTPLPIDDPGVNAAFDGDEKQEEMF